MNARIAVWCAPVFLLAIGAGLPARGGVVAAAPSASISASESTSPSASAPPSASASATPGAPSASATYPLNPAGPDFVLWHPNYLVELEGHITLAYLEAFGFGAGGGARLSVPFIRKWPVRGGDNALAVSVGLDIVHFNYLPGGAPDGETIPVIAFYVPAAIQWNFWLGSLASVFIEPTLNFRYATFPENCPTQYACSPTTAFLPMIAIGARFRVVDDLAVTVRLSWPLMSLGASWL